MMTQDPISARLRQFALAQLDLAITYLADARRNPDVAIHETRRCLKRVRAILRLVKAELAASVYDRENRYLRNIGRRLAALRDAAVRGQTMAALKEEFATQLSSNTWRELKKQLAAAQTSAQQKRKVMTALVPKLRTARTRVEKWSLEFDEITVLQRGLRKTYRRGQRAMAQVWENPSAETFHEWRKQVNHLRHQLQVLQTLQLNQDKETLRAYKSLAEVLGQKNDLHVLSTHLQRRRRQTGESVQQSLRVLIEQRDIAFGESAFRLGQQLYERKAKAFIRRLWA